MTSAPAPTPDPAPPSPAAPAPAPPPARPTPPNLNDPAAVAALFDQAAAANLLCPGRRGATVHLAAPGTLIASGDLHDHTLNLQRLVKLAALHLGPDRHLTLHEILHGSHLVNGRDLSIRTMARIAALKTQYPNQVHPLLANHDLAQVTGGDILKAGHSVGAAFLDGLDYLYGGEAEAVMAALTRFVKSFPLAVKCPNGILCTHSLPAPSRLAQFDRTILDRPLTDADYAPDGSAYALVWGRNHTQELADDLAQTWGVTQFVMGHQPAEMGYETLGQTMLVLASDDEHGVALPIDLERPHTRDDLVERLVPLAGVPV